MRNGHTYVLGTGLSQDGSLCLIKDGEVCIAINKEELAGKKNDGYTDGLAVKHCMDAEGIDLGDLDLIVQSGKFLSELTQRYDFHGRVRLFPVDFKVPIVSISHHLALAYHAIGSCSFVGNFDVLVVDSFGSPFTDCMDLEGCEIPDRQLIHPDISHLYFEKDSFYSYENDELISKFKDFASAGFFLKDGSPNEPERMEPFTLHSIGGVYEIISYYCFNDSTAVERLIELSAQGVDRMYESVFILKEGRIFLNRHWLDSLNKPAKSQDRFELDFQYYADIAWHVQNEMEKAIAYLISNRLKCDKKYLCYVGDTGLNERLQQLIETSELLHGFYVPQVKENGGVALGCAYYGWLHLLDRKKRVSRLQTID